MDSVKLILGAFLLLAVPVLIAMGISKLLGFDSDGAIVAIAAGVFTVFGGYMASRSKRDDPFIAKYIMGTGVVMIVVGIVLGIVKG